MKKLLIITVWLVVLSAMESYAQISIKASYKPSYFVSTDDIVAPSYMHGFAMDVSYNIPISIKIPLGIEAGLGFHYMLQQSEVDLKISPMATDTQLSNVFLPVRLTYDVPLSKNAILAPYAGLHARYFLHYKIITTWVEQQRPPEIVYPFKSEHASEYLYRGQIGGQIGLLLKANEHFVAELGYAWDFGYFINRNNAFSDEKERFHTLTLGIGYRF